jgi:hypothetical protein
VKGSRFQRVQCQTCPAKNRHVKEVTVKRTNERFIICPLCRAVLEKMEREFAEQQKQAA